MKAPQSTGTPAPLVALETISKRFPGVVANNRISFALYAGEVHVLLGENGAGKSTLISLLSGLQQPDEGKIVFDGRPVRLRSPRQALRLGIGSVYQHSSLAPSLSVLENLCLGAPWWRPLNKKSIRDAFRIISGQLQLSLAEDAPLGCLSLGEQQMVEIIKALWLGRRLLILDEATSLLPPEGIEKLQRAVLQLKNSGTAVLFITHKLTEALAFGDRISVLRSGRLVGTLHRAGRRCLDNEE